MKQINVISPVYKNQAVNFNGFIVNFNVEGKGVMTFEDNQTENVDKVFETHLNIYKGDKLPIFEQKGNTISEINNSDSNTEVEILKESNKKLAIENSNLKKENASLKKENEELKNKICTLMQEKKVDTNFENKEVEKSSDEIEKGDNTDASSIKEDLDKKTIAQLKELLNTEDFLPFKEEWKNLTKKDEIINFILDKIEKN